MYKATLRDIEQKGLGADEAHTALLREVSDEHPAGLEGQPPGPHCPGVMVVFGVHVFRRRGPFVFDAWPSLSV